MQTMLRQSTMLRRNQTETNDNGEDNNVKSYDNTMDGNVALAGRLVWVIGVRSEGADTQRGPRWRRKPQIARFDA